VRRLVIAFCRWAARMNLSVEDAARRLGVVVSTLRSWQIRWRKDRLRPRARGRPARRSARDVRARALALIWLLGPGVGVPPLQALCPSMARRELQDLLGRYRRVWRRRFRQLAKVLHWKRAGTVWAIDCAEPPAPVDGVYGQLLAVRDLASSYQLLWLPTEEADATTVLTALQGLFREHGRPLVLKTDNGSPFIANILQDAMRRFHVWQLFSPPAWPQYNGSCEAGIGSMKTRTHHESRRRGFPGQWTCDDMEAARLQANELARPWGHLGPTPTEAWQARKPITLRDRQQFAGKVQVCLRRNKTRRENASRVRAARREALAQALVEHGLLEVTTRNVPKPYPARRRKRKSADSRE